jgi:hypothetical protein
MKLIVPLLLSSLALGSLLAWSVKGSEGSCCPQCGSNQLTPVCRQVPVITKVPKVEYSCKCGDICVPGRSIYCGKECVTDCDGKCHHQHVYQPTCGKTYPTVTLVKTTTMVEKCSYKCVVEYACSNCGCNCSGASCTASTSYPPAPMIQLHAEPHPLRTQSN